MRDSNEISAIEIGHFAIELARLAGIEKSLYSEDAFKTLFVFSYNLLVDAELQLLTFRTKKAQQNST